MNIIWKLPDGKLAVTFITPETEQMIARAMKAAHLVPQEEAMRAERQDLMAVLESGTEAKPELYERLDQIDIGLSQIGYYKAVEKSHGLSSQAHARLLLDVSDSAHAGWEPVAFDVADLPTQQQDAWRWDGAAIVIDIEALREIVKNNVRWARAPMLIALDTEIMRNSETGQDNTPVVARKNALRNATKLVDALSTVEELSKVDVFKLLQEAT